MEKCSRVYECANVIARSPDGRWYLPGPVRTDYMSASVHVGRDVPQGWSVAADVHSHPCVPGLRTDMFSDNDIISALLTRTVGYMVDLCTGAVHEFIPGETRVDEVEVEPGVFLTGGKIIGHVPAYPDDAKANTGF